MKIEYDKSADAAYIRFSSAKVKETIEIKEGLLADLDKNGNVRGLEILNFLRSLPKKERHIEIGKKKIFLPAFA